MDVTFRSDPDDAAAFFLRIIPIIFGRALLPVLPGAAVTSGSSARPLLRSARNLSFDKERHGFIATPRPTGGGIFEHLHRRAFGELAALEAPQKPLAPVVSRCRCSFISLHAFSFNS
jgi:hypothetical protein